MIRPLQPSDARFLCSIFSGNDEYYNIFFDPETDISEWEIRVGHILSDQNTHHFIIENDHEPVGWFSFEDLSDTECSIGIIVVKREHLHCGYGREALLWLTDRCRKRGAATLTLNVNQNNNRAIRFYRQFGFTIYAEEIIPECNDAVNLKQYKMKLDIA